jgi:sterol 3beta-glucosyltransferase
VKVLIVTAGSRGDVAPYTGLGARLRAAGHHVAVAAQSSFAELVAGCGLEFRPLPGDLRALQVRSTARLLRRSGPGLRGFAEFVRIGRRFVDEIGDGLVAAADPGVDVMLLSATTAPLGYSVAELYGVPSLGVFLQPVQPTADFPPMMLGAGSFGGLVNRAAGQLGQAVGRRVYEQASRRLRERCGLPPADLRELARRSAGARWPVLHGFSPAVVPRPADWPAELEVVGYWWPEPGSPWRAPPELVDFLSAGPPPVYVGFGSVVSEGDRLTELIASALRRTGLRGVVQAGWAGLSGVRTENDDLITIGEAPHDWLFPRMAALVHHAGNGTTAAGLRAGVPAVPVPMLADQPFWAARLSALGAGPDPIAPRRLTDARLAAAVRAAVYEPSYTRRARALAAELATEDGAGAVLRAVDRLAG